MQNFLSFKDAFSSGQVGSKLWLCKQLEQTGWTSNLTYIYGGWYGITAFLLLSRNNFKVDQIQSFDIDPSCEPIADMINENWVWQDWKFKGYMLNSNEMALIKPEPFGKPQYGLEGPQVELVRIWNRNPNLSVNAGDYFAATKINYEWRIVSAGGGGSCVVGKFKRINCAASPTDKSSIPIPAFYLNPSNQKWILDFGKVITPLTGHIT